jgi:hypothetical protein
LRVTLAYPRDGHDAGATVDYPLADARRLVREGMARVHVVGDEPAPTTVKPSRADVDAYAAEHGITKADARRRLAATPVAPARTTTLPTAPAAADS